MERILALLKLLWPKCAMSRRCSRGGGVRDGAFVARHHRLDLGFVRDAETMQSSIVNDEVTSIGSPF
jgi:hypothetical protein